MTTVDVKVGGAWAALRQQQEQQEAVIHELCCQLSSLQISYDQLSDKFDQLQNRHDRVAECYKQSQETLEGTRLELAKCVSNFETISFTKQELEVSKQEEIDCLSHVIEGLHDAAANAQASHKQQVFALEQQIAELRDIIACSMHTKRASTLRLETAMNALNLSRADATRFIEELQAVKGKVETLAEERDRACLASVTVRQQRDCHANHADLLVKENKRLLGQLQTLRLQQASAPAAESLNAKMQTDIDRSRRRSTADKADDKVLPDMSKNKAPGRKASKQFCGENVQNVLHSKPFDLSLKTAPKQETNVQGIVLQAQQMRAAQHRT